MDSQWTQYGDYVYPELYPRRRVMRLPRRNTTPSTRGNTSLQPIIRSLTVFTTAPLIEP